MERDLESGAQDINFIHFNSHAHVERDAKEYLQNAYKIISTHTLTWSVTILLRGYLPPVSNFNSHAHVERDVRCTSRSDLHELFQLTRSRGA